MLKLVGSARFLLILLLAVRFVVRARRRQVRVSGPAAAAVQHNGRMKTIVRLLACALAMFFSMIIAAPFAAACSCADLTLEEQVESAAVVARVIVEKTSVVTRDDGGEQVTLTMRPTRVWKGDVVSKFSVMTALDIPECGLGALAEGTDLLLFANESEGQFSANRCGGSTAASESGVAELVGVAGQGEFIDPVVGDEPGAFVWPTVAAVAAVVIVGGVIAYWWILPRHRR